MVESNHHLQFLTAKLGQTALSLPCTNLQLGGQVQLGF